MMNRCCLLVLFLTMIAVNVRGQVLYSVKGKSLKGESYILFVDNMLPSSALIGVKNVFRCYNRTKVVVSEIVKEEPENLWEMMKSQSPLTDFLSQDEIVMVDSVLKADCKMSLDNIRRLKPAAINMMWRSEICRSLYERGDEDLPMDSYFQYVALLEGKKIVALDWVSGTGSLTQEDIALQSRAMIDDFSRGRNEVENQYRKAYSLFKSGNVRELGKMQTERDLCATVDAWIDNLVSVMKTDRCFVVVYAKYYNGGLIDKLKKMSLKVKEVK